MQCSQCQHDNPASLKFCGECGAKLLASCSSCGTANAPTQKFCGECGSRLATGTTTPATPDMYTPKHLAEKILTSKAALEGERKQVTVLFADLKGSMELLADRDPEEARRLLDPVLERMMDAVHRYEGTVNQVMGDGIMALFGAPLAHEDHGIRACYAALRMQEAVKGYAETVFRSHGITVRIRVGLNSGEVVVRAIGSDLRMDYTAVGQTTHLAARMEQLADPGTILLTLATLQLAEGYIEVKARGPVPIKGLSESIEVFDLVGAGVVRSRLHAAVSRGLTRFVGRDSEIDQLRHALERAEAGHGQLAAVVGEPGVGKSRLYWEFTHSHRTQGWLILESGSVSYGKATAYLPLIDLLKAYFQIEGRDDTRKMREKVTGKVLSLDRQLESMLPSLLSLLDIPVEDAAWQRLDPPQRRQRTLDGVKHLLLRECQVQPLLLLFEDLHWVDAETQALLDNLVESLPTARILLLVNYRPEYQHGWSSKTYYRQLRIDPLPAESAEDLLASLLGDDPGLQPLMRFLIARTEGNPLFLEESVRALVETQVLVGQRGAYQLERESGAIQVPATVQTILAARIDRLSQEDKRLLQAASVVGKDVPFGLLQAIADLPDDALRQSLARLQASEFLYEARLFPDLEYTFKHALTHDVAYGSLLGDRRRDLHAGIVEAIERFSASRLGEQIELLAHHAERGEVWDKAARYLHQAGAKAAARSAYPEAVGYFGRALTALKPLSETADTRNVAIDIYVDMGPVLIAFKSGASKEVEDTYQRARELCERAGEKVRLFPVLWGLWYVENLRGHHQIARKMGERLLELAQRNGDPAQILQAHHSLWPGLIETGEFAAAEGHLREGLKLYDAQQHRSHVFLYGNHDPGVCCRQYAGRRLWIIGFPDRALASTTDATRLAREIGHPFTTALALYYAAVIHYWRGESQTAVERALEVIGLMSEHGIFAWFVLAARLLWYLLDERGRGETTVVQLHRELTELKTAGRAGGREAFLGSLVAQAYAATGDVATALGVLGESLRLAEAGIEPYYEAELHRLHGELRFDSGASPADVEACFRRAVEVARRQRARSMELRAATSLARLLASEGGREEARQVLGDIYGAFTEGFDTADLREAQRLLHGSLTA